MPVPHRILVVNDEEKIRKSLSGLLQDNGYEVVTAKNGPECLQTMSSQDFDLVILDIVMPGISGIEVLQGIKERYKDTEVIMITGYADKEKAIAASRLNAYDFIEKPFESGEILKTIAHYLTQLNLRKDIEKKSQELRESEKKYRQLFETLQEGIWVIDKDAYTTLVNPRMAEILGYTESEMLGKHLFSFMDEHVVELAKRYLERRQQGIKERHDFEFIRKDGSRIYTSLDTAPVTDEKGNYAGAIAAVQDITERKKAEEASKESEERHKDLFDSANDLIQIVTPEGHFLYVNCAWQETLGYNEDEIAGLSLFDIIHPDSQAHCKALFQRMMSGEKVDKVEAEIVARDGRKIVVEGSAKYKFIGDKAVYAQCIFHDITERQQIEALLTKTLNEYENIMNTVPEIICLLNLNGNLKKWNRKGEIATGFSAEELMGKNVLDFFPEEENAIISETIQEVFKKGYGDVEGHLLCKNGTLIPYRWTGVTLKDEDGKVIGIIGVGRDITERKKAEKALKDSEERYRTLVENALVGVYRTNLKGDFLYVNKALSRMFEFDSPEEMMSSGVLPRYKNPKDREVLIENLKKKEKVDNLEIEIFTKTGKTKNILINATLDGDVMSGMAMDITERKKAEEFIKDIFESISGGLAVIDLDYRVVTANRGYYEHAGMTLEDIIGKHCYKVTHHRDKPCYEEDEECAVKHTFETGEFHTAIHKHYDREGRLLYVEIRSYPLKDSSGKVISAIEIVSDITEKKRLEDQLRHAQKMETVGTLAGGIAHDFNNILTAIIGYEHILQMEMRKDDPSKVYADRILALAERAANLTQGLLAFSRKQVIDLRPVNLNEIIKRIEGIIARVIGEDIELETIITDEELTVMADSGQIELVLMNLCTNARDAMPEGGQLKIKTEPIELGSEFIKTHGYGKPGMFAHIVVTDTGTGMDEETRRRIFEPFFTTKEVGKGTGLGLAIAYGTIKQHNGYINVYSTPGGGTTFTIYLPLIKTEVEETRLTELAIPAGGTETVLIAEDDAEVRKLTKSILTGFGYAVIEAVDGEDAINKFMENKDRIQLLLLDIIMPKKSGKVVYEEIRNIRPDVKALFTSGYAIDIIQKIGILEEGLNFVLKPISPKELLRKVREVLDK